MVHLARGAFTGRDVMAAYSQVMAMREAAVNAAPVRFRALADLADPALRGRAAAPGNDPRNALPHIAFTVPYNMSEQPAASVNWSFSADGLPVGVQVVGQRFDDAGVLRRPPPRAAAPGAAAWLE